VETIGVPLLLLCQVVASEMAGSRNQFDVRVTDELLRIESCTRVEYELDTGRFGVVRQKALRDIGLLIQINDQTPLSSLLTDRGKQPAEMSLADAAFEIQRRDDDTVG